MENRNFTLVSIEGNIGSGKSTLMKNLKEYYKNNKQVLFLKEPVDEWEKIKDSNGITILEKFYKDQDKYSFSFQMMAYISRLNVLRNTLKILDPHKKYIIISERCLYTDKLVFAKMLFESGKMEDIMYQIYLNWFDSFSEEFPIHKIIYVKTLPQICHDRIHTRSRDGEENIPLDYLESCHKYHEDMLQNNNICDEKLLLDGNIDIFTNKNQLDDWIYQINYFVHH